MATRKYEQRLRADAAAETRRRILDAVYQRLREAPSEPVSIDRIARMARVARPTVYLVFGSRAGLFEAVGADLRERGGFGRMLQAAAHPDAREALRGGICGVVTMYAAHRDVCGCCLRWPCLTPPRPAARSSGWNKAGRAEWPASLSGWLTKRRCVPMSAPAKPPTCCGY